MLVGTWEGRKDEGGRMKDEVRREKGEGRELRIEDRR
jgi:hypothetical protein